LPSPQELAKVVKDGNGDIMNFFKMANEETRGERREEGDRASTCGSSYMSTCYINIGLCAWTCLATGVTYSNKFKNLD
jgi:hypothetical protein